MKSYIGNILIACEYSGLVRDAFEDKGWYAISVDLLPTESKQTETSGRHYTGDVIDFLKYEEQIKWLHLKKRIENFKPAFDILIGFPPCTYLSFAYTGKERYSTDRLQKKIEAYQFFLNLWNTPIKHICLENPMGYAHTGLLPYSQVIEPYYFGHNYRKKTCLWLKDLPPLIYSKEDNLFEKATAYQGEIQYFINGSSQRKTKKKSINKPFCDPKLKSKFHEYIANAMAEQWTEYFKSTQN